MPNQAMLSTAGKSLAKTGGFMGRTFGAFFKFKIMSFFMIIILLNITFAALSAHSWDVFFQQLGVTFLTPTLGLQQIGINIVQNGGLWIAGNSTISNIWNVISNLFVIVSQLYIFVFYIKVLAWLISKSPLSNNSNDFINWTLGTIFFYGFQIIYVLSLRIGPASLPLTATWTFIKSIPAMIAPLSSFAQSFIDSIQNVKSTLGISNATNISNITNTINDTVSHNQNVIIYNGS